MKMFSGNKKGVAMAMTLLILVVAVVAVVWFTGSGNVPTLAATTPATTSGGGSGQALCAKEDATVTLSAVDAYDSSVTILGNHKYRIDTKWQDKADSASLTADPQANVRVAFGAGNKSGVGVFAWTKIAEEKLECVGEKTITGELYRNGTLTLQYFNADDGQLNSLAQNESLAAGNVITGVLKYESQFERSAGPYGFVAVIEGNKTTYDTFVIDGSGVSKANVPTHYTITNSNHITKAYNMPAATSSGKKSFSFVIDVDDTNGPGLAESFGGGSNVRVTLYPKDYFLNTATNNYELGVEDQDGAALTSRPTYVLDIQVS